MIEHYFYPSSVFYRYPLLLVARFGQNNEDIIVVSWLAGSEASSQSPPHSLSARHDTAHPRTDPRCIPGGLQRTLASPGRLARTSSRNQACCCSQRGVIDARPSQTIACEITTLLLKRVASGRSTGGGPPPPPLPPQTPPALKRTKHRARGRSVSEREQSQRRMETSRASGRCSRMLAPREGKQGSWGGRGREKAKDKLTGAREAAGAVAGGF